ncbi:acyltransferase family protein [Pseudaestuariivita atlantica]|uniref:Acyltransferase n=1 Tax=Pseudaestuariivita atlantica TaxID=1317121 RepID=A0A0L1JQ70_9RHOB|nr:acyltransferase family protein [Pseudaestuariivita atlantica]KNG93543.1 acyltransferase [Pseudaestuariivita atlantica]
MPAPDHHDYRPEIDGLRAIAVMSVVLYHFGVPGLSGGFVGVDVFFVISGFLIGGLLWAEHRDTGTLRIGAFYVRRFRRLAPAFFTMALVTAVVGWWVLLPFEYREFGKALIASAVYLSNVLFYRSAGYFDSAAEEKPLLHTWSLSVEEQFYIVLPLALLILARWPRLCLAVLVGIATASLALCILVTPVDQPATFYLFPYRAWELLAGVLLAIWGHGRAQDWDAHPALSWLGLALVLLGIALIQPGPGFPGVAALLPVLGTVLLLLNGRNDNPVNSVLSMKVPVFIGLISYSLYLWHWPVVTLGGYWLGGEASALQALVGINLSFGLAILSWAFVERPVRRSRKITPRRLVTGVVASSATLLAIGGVLFVRDGVPERFDAVVARHIEASGDFLQDFSRCRVEPDGPLAGIEVCPIGPEGAPRVLVWGDSHARAWHDGIALAASEADVPGILIWTAGCPPFFGTDKTESAATPAQDARCFAINAQIAAALPALPDMDKVLLIGRWTYYAEGGGVGLDAGNRIALRAQGGEADPFAAGFERTVATLLDHFNEVLVLRQVPEIAGYQSRTVARALVHGRMTAEEADAAMATSREDLAARNAGADGAINALAEAGAVTLLDPWPDLCDDAGCRAAGDGAVWFFDNNHLTNTGARELRGILAPLFARDGG